MSTPYGQRAKARDFMKAEGHGDQLKHVNVTVVDKNEMVHGNRIGSAEPAKTGQVYEQAMLDTDGLARHHAHRA